MNSQSTSSTSDRPLLFSGELPGLDLMRSQISALSQPDAVAFSTELKSI
jgi:hypothetical protein